MNLLMQHWHGEMGELELASREAMMKYAAEHDAVYTLVEGEPLGPNLAPQMHKLYALDPHFDRYDVVVVTDMDMFPSTACKRSIFDERGIGVMTGTQLALRRRLHDCYAALTDPLADYYGGAVYRFEAGIRQLLRPNLKRSLKPEFVQRFQDEGCMHYMAGKANLRECQLPDGERWAMSSYTPGVETAHMIHIRTKTTPGGPKVTKLENYRRLVQQGLIAP